MLRRTELRRSARMKRGPIKARNAKRRQSEFARTYGSTARVEFVQSLPCVFRHTGECRGPVDNAHTETGGMRRKADASTIAPLCRAHHRLYDTHAGAFAHANVRAMVTRAAARTEQAWQSHQQSQNR